jgi:multidrug efflux pump subunit AcrA (membrane-fusion protein)
MNYLKIDTMGIIKNTIGVVLVFFVFFLIGCNPSEPTQYNDEFEENIPTQPMQDMPIQPITGNVVAVVNGEEINSKDLEEIQMLLLQQGQQISNEDLLEQLINQKVLEQKVQQENIVVTTEEAESVIEQQLTMQGATLDDYKQQVESTGVSYEAELENIKNQIATQQFLESQLEGQTFDVTEEEAQEFYEMYKAQSPEEVPSYEELQSQIIATLEQQKQQEAINDFVNELRLKAVVDYK